MASHYQLSLADWCQLARRRLPLFTAVLVPIALIGLLVAGWLPATYRSTGTILIESQQIPTEIVPTTVTMAVDERIQVIKQRVMTRANLGHIIERHGLAATLKESGADPVAWMEKRIGIELISARNGRSTVTVAFNVWFEHTDPDIAVAVASDLVTLFLNENIRARNERASETTEFLSQEAHKLKSELERLETQVADYKQLHRDALPEHVPLRIAMVQRLETELKRINSEHLAVQEEIRFLDLEAAAARRGAVVALTQGASAAGGSLAELKRQHDDLLALYTESHPDVVALRQTITLLESGAVAGQGTAGEGTANAIPPESTSNMLLQQVQARLDSAIQRLAALDAQADEVKHRIDEIDGQILLAPQVERHLTQLTRDHDNARHKYEEVNAKLIDARIAESLEAESRAERFSLIEPPLRPEQAASSSRLQIGAIGLMVALALAGGAALLAEMADQRIHGPGTLTQLMRQPPLAVIPFVEETRQNMRRGRSEPHGPALDGVTGDAIRSCSV